MKIQVQKVVYSLKFIKKKEITEFKPTGHIKKSHSLAVRPPLAQITAHIHRVVSIIHQNLVFMELEI